MSSFAKAAEKKHLFPFISAAGYRAISDLQLDNLLSQEMPEYDTADRSVIFVDFKSSKKAEYVFKKWVGSFVGPNRFKFIFANGDDVPSPELRGLLSNRGHEVFSVDVLDNEPGVTPIPVGMQVVQNPTQNESVISMHNYINNSLSKDKDKDILIYNNFSLYDSDAGRKELREKIRETRFDFFDNGLSQKEYFDKILRSKFVVSPRGMSPDCYRTWESIYLGAVPIILKDTLPESITSGLPIWIVDSWEEVLESNDEDLNERFLDLKEKSLEKAMMNYWRSVILNSSR